MFRILLILAILLGGLVVPVAMPESVQADPDTVYLWPDGDTTSEFSTSPGQAAGNHYLNINQAACGVGSYVYTNQWSAGWTINDVYTIEDFNVANNGINSITVGWGGWQSGGVEGTGSSRIYVNGVGGGCNHTVGAVWCTATYATNPATGLAWTDSELDDLTVDLQMRSVNPGVEARCYCLRVTVDYDPATVPTVTTSAADNISHSGTQCWADFHGNITDRGGEDVLCRGFVWDTVSHDPLASDNVTPPNGYSDNISYYTAGDWGTGVFSHPEGLNCCGTYYYRAFAGNSLGWDYGEEQTFKVMCNPDIDSQAASYVQGTTARLNSLIISDGEQACDVRFCYGTSMAACTDDALACGFCCNCSTYDTTTAWVNDTYITGQTPYVDLTSLDLGTTYYFCTQIRNDMSSWYGGELSFATETGINMPTDFQGIPTPTEISLAWVKSAGSTNVLVRYKLGDYPDSLTDGELVYFDTMNSVVHDSESSMALALHDGLTPGTIYFYRAWGESGGTYSSDNATLMMTTLAIAPGGDAFPTPATPSQWFQAPDYTNMRYMPFYPIVNFAADQFGMPYATIWYMLALAVCAGAGIVFYSGFGNHNLVLSIFVVGVMIMLGSFLELIPMWHMIVFGVLAAVGIFVGERR